MDPRSAPRVLVVTPNTFNSVSGGGITLSNLFRGWPRGRLAIIHEDGVPGDPSICSNEYRLGAEERPFIWPLSLLSRARPNHTREIAQSRETSDPTRRQDGAASALRARLLGPAGGVVGLAGGAARAVRVTRQLREWLEGFQPQVVYTHLGTLGQMELVSSILEQNGAPLVIHMMDDWPAVMHRRGLLAPWLRRRALAALASLMSRASVRMAISHEMGREYRGRYGYEFSVFHNVVERAAWAGVSREEWSVATPARVVYAGSIVANAQRRALHDVCRAVAGLRASGVAVFIEVHAPADQARHLAEDSTLEDVLRLFPVPTDAELPSLLTQADVLVLPSNFDRFSARYVRLSMPTKVPAYMMSGTPILVHGPSASAVARYALEAAWGWVHGVNDVTSLAAALRHLLSDIATRERLGRCAKEVAEREHDAAVVKPAFWATLTRAAGTDALRGPDEREGVALRRDDGAGSMPSNHRADAMSRVWPA